MRHGSVLQQSSTYGCKDYQYIGREHFLGNLSPKWGAIKFTELRQPGKVNYTGDRKTPKNSGDTVTSYSYGYANFGYYEVISK